MRSLQLPYESLVRLHGDISFSHNDTFTQSCAYELGEVASIRILLPRLLGVISVSLQIFKEDCKTVVFNKTCEWVDIDSGFDVYDCDLDIEKLGTGLYFFKLCINSIYGDIYGIRKDRRISFTDNEYDISLFQLSVSDFKYGENASKYGGIIYHIFVDRFNRGGDVKLKDGVITDDDWRYMPEYPAYPGAPLKNNHFYGGTLWGIIDKLDYIKSLGVDTIYLSPVFDATSNHKYDTADYMNVDQMFGGNNALDELIKAAKKLDIGIILDGVFNHTGSDSIYFNKEGKYDSLGAYQSTKSPYYSWYDFKSYPDKYTSWWGIDILPRINPDVQKCRKYFVGKNGVIEKYAKMGIAGFRLDVVDELSDDFVAEIKAVLNKYNPQSTLYGEVWEDASNKIAYDKRKKYYLGNELDGVMNYPIRKGIIEFLTQFDCSSLEYALTDVVNNAPKRIRDFQMNLLGTHDTERILTVLGGARAEGRSNDYLCKKKMDDLERGTAKRRLRMAYVILCTVPGIPAIFYADEAGMEGYSDPFNRMPYPWGREDNNLINYYRRVGSIRRENDAYKCGDFILNHISNQCLVFTRRSDEVSLITVVNNSKLPIKVEFSKRARALIVNTESTKFSIPEYTAEIFRVNNGIEMSF